MMELLCAAIVVQFVVIRARRDPEPRAFLARLLALSLAAWIGEDTCIRLYGFYQYHPVWSLWADVTPLLVPLIWPVVIHSAWDLARLLLADRRRRVPLVVAALVLADASFIEPIAVAADLWHWTAPGPFGVPPIGVLGWAFFALLAVGMLERFPGLLQRPQGWLAFLVAVPLGCHLLLLATWWGALRWLSGPIPDAPAVGLAVVVSLVLTTLALARRVRDRVPLTDMLLRVPAALFFGGLLVLHAADQTALVVWTLAFVPPYTACVKLRESRPG